MCVAVGFSEGLNPINIFKCQSRSPPYHHTNNQCLFPKTANSDAHLLQKDPDGIIPPVATTHPESTIVGNAHAPVNTAIVITSLRTLDANKKPRNKRKKRPRSEMRLQLGLLSQLRAEAESTSLLTN